MPHWSNLFVLELINSVAENSFVDKMPEKSKKSPKKSPEKGEVKEVKGPDRTVSSEKNNKKEEAKDSEKEKPKKMSHKDYELLVENLILKISPPSKCGPPSSSQE